MYAGSYFYLLETSKYNMNKNILESHIAICDSGMVPLALLPFQLPEGSSNTSAFFAP